MLLAALDDARVDACGGLDVRVPEELGDARKRHALVEQDRTVRVRQVVRADVPELRMPSGLVIQ